MTQPNDPDSQPLVHPQLSLNRIFLPSPSKRSATKSLSHQISYNDQIPHSAPPPSTKNQINQRSKFDFYSPNVRRSSSNTHTILTPTNQNNNNNAQRRHSRFNTPSRRGPPDSSSLWYHMTLRLTQLPTLHVLITSFIPRSRKAAKRIQHTFCLLHSSAMSGRAWGPVGGARPLADVLTLSCSPNELRTRGLRVSVFQHGRGVRATELGVAFFRVSDFIIPPRQQENSGQPLACTPTIASVNLSEDMTDSLPIPGHKNRSRDMDARHHHKSSIGTLEVRAVIAPLQPIDSIYGLDISIHNGLSVKKELKGCSLVVLRTCHGTNTMTVAQTVIEKNGERFGDIKIPRAILWFGVEQSMKDKVGIRLEWTKCRTNGLLGTGLKGKENRYCFGQLDLNVEKIHDLKQNEMLQVSWKEAPNIVSVNRLAVVDSTEFSNNRLGLELTLTR